MSSIATNAADVPQHGLIDPPSTSPTSALHVHGSHAGRGSATVRDRLTQFALGTAGLALAGASTWTAVTYGLDRAGVLGGLSGFAAAAILLAAPSAARTSRRAPAIVLWALAAPFAVASAIGAQQAHRSHAANVEVKVTGDRTRAEQSYRSARAGLDKLPASRSVDAVETALAAALIDPRLADCQGWLESVKLRATCVNVVEPLRSELATARERARLDTAVADADDTLRSTPAPKQANSDALALSRLAGRLGVSVDAGVVEDLLSVLMVALVEIGGGLCLTLAFAASAAPAHPRARVTNDTADVNGGTLTSIGTSAAPAIARVAPAQLGTVAAAMTGDARGGVNDESGVAGAPVLTTVKAVGVATEARTPTEHPVVALVRQNGGMWSGSQRGLARLIGIDAASVNRAIVALASAGVLTVATSSAGTVLKLAA